MEAKFDALLGRRAEVFVCEKAGDGRILVALRIFTPLLFFFKFSLPRGGVKALCLWGDRYGA